MIVVDTNIISYLYLSSERARQAEQVRRLDAHWVAPMLWRSEFRNVLTFYLRKHRLSVETAQRIMSEALQAMYEGEYEVNSAEVLRLAASSTCSAYECEFVALASDLKVPLVTVDRQILRDFPKVSISLDHFAQAK